MTKRGPFVICSLLFSVLLSAPVVFGQACRLSMGGDGDPEVWLEGTIGDSKVRVYLNTEPDGRIDGVLYDMANWTPVALGGTRTANCELRISEGRQNRTWQGSFKTGVLEGTWRNPQGETGTIRLQRIAPMACDRRGKWVTWTNPRFPISFEYPEGWRVIETSEKEIRLVCPDPRTMQFAPSGLAIKSIDTKDASNQIGRFIRVGAKWLVSSSEFAGGCAAPGALCMEARTSKQNGITVVQGSGPTRTYHLRDRSQGSVEEDAYVLLVHDRPVFLSSVSVRKDVTERIVRSVKPRPE